MGTVKAHGDGTMDNPQPSASLLLVSHEKKDCVLFND
jgi:hypothetical protein